MSSSVGPKPPQQLNPEFICSKCNQLLEDPVELNECCGKLVCARHVQRDPQPPCDDEGLEVKSDGCPCCGDRNFQFFFSKRVANAIANEIVACPNEDCDFQCPRRDFQHACRFCKIQCEGCEKFFLAGDEAAVRFHEARDCIARSCPHKLWTRCTFRGTKQEMDFHEQTMNVHIEMACDYSTCLVNTNNELNNVIANLKTQMSALQNYFILEQAKSQRLGQALKNRDQVIEQIAKKAAVPDASAAASSQPLFDMMNMLNISRPPTKY